MVLGKLLFRKFFQVKKEATEGEVQIKMVKKWGFHPQNQSCFSNFTIFDVVLIGNKRLFDAVKVIPAL